MELNGYEIKNKTTCECGYEFTIQDMQKLQRLPETIYGGVIKHVDEIKCPKCGKDTLLLLKQQGQTYIVKDIGQKDVKTENNEDNEATQEFICDICGNAFKSKSGLSSHKRSHIN